ncbi:MAG: DNA-directed RNA polymerase subunit alpha [Prevotellaceae bacterium]|nr:DNA-directed RNA polymerase subunit alpha [Prevotellaceae bacterium]
MAILTFQKPDKVIMLESTATFGRFEFRPLEQNYGITVGNALRRVLLSSLEGYAITSVKIHGVDHEFASIPGVREDMVDIILNLKQVRLKKIAEGAENENFRISISGQTQFKAEQLSNSMSVFKVLNSDLVICNMEPSVKLQMEFNIGKGRGFVPAEENKVEGSEIGLIAIDSIHSPIINVNYTREDYRVDQKTDYDRLVLEITTDGSIHPKEALKEAAKILIQHFALFSDEKITIDTEEEKFTNDDFDEEVLHMRQLLKTKLIDLDLSVRALNCLKTAEVETLGELVKFQRNDLLKFRNFGKKSLTELDEKLMQLNLNFGMDILKYKLDKD